MRSHVASCTGQPPIDPLGLSQLCKFSLGVLVLAYVISSPWVLLSRALKLCTCSVGPGNQKEKKSVWVLLSRALKLCTCSVGPDRQKRKEKVFNWLYCQVQPQTLPKLYKK